MSSTHVRSTFISDVHLGTSACQAQYLLDFLESCQMEYLYLAGGFIPQPAVAPEYTAEWIASTVMKRIGKTSEFVRRFETRQGQLELQHWADHKEVLVREADLTEEWEAIPQTN